MKTIFVVLSLILPPTAWATPKAQICKTCHGEKGISPKDSIPNLAGQKAEYIVRQLREFQAGLRGGMMAPFAARLSKADMAELADYFSNLKPECK